MKIKLIGRIWITAAAVGLLAWLTLGSGQEAVLNAQAVVPTHGLVARYVAAFDGAGIETSAILGEYCKYPESTGGTFKFICQDDTSTETTHSIITANPTGAVGSGVLNKLQIGADIYGISGSGAGTGITAINGTSPISASVSAATATIEIADATATSSGAMSAADFVKLDALEDDAEELSLIHISEPTRPY